MTGMTRAFWAANSNDMKKNLIINIGRQFGSGGKDIALQLGQLLGIPVYDKELIAQAAQDSGFSKELFENMDEKKNFFSAFSIEVENFVNDSGLFKIQSETIMNIAAQGPAIIVGRCSDYILRDYDNTVDVFITAPVEDRIARTMEKEQLDEAEAATLVGKKDRQRESYYNYYTFGNWGTASNYDLCIDSSILGIKGTAELLAHYIRTVKEQREA